MNTLSGWIRFGYGIIAGSAGSLVLGLTLLAGWSILGDALTTPEITINALGIEERRSALHPLFHVLTVLAVFLSTLTAFITHALLGTIAIEFEKPRKIIITQVFFSQVVLLFLLIPAYLLGKSIGGVPFLGVIAIFHAISGLLLTQSIIKKPTLLRNFGFLLGIAVFLMAILVLSGVNTTLTALLVLPLVVGLAEWGDYFSEFLYTWFTRTYGVEILTSTNEKSEKYDEEYEE